MAITLLGIDPGFASLGFACVEVHSLDRAVPTRERLVVRQVGIVKTAASAKKLNVRASEDNLRRAREMFRDLHEAIREIHPSIIACETMSWPQNLSVVAKMAIGWGVIASIAELYDYPVVQASPQQVKQQMCEVKWASKKAVQAGLREIFPGLAWRDFAAGDVEHVADALAVAITCLDSDVVRAAFAARKGGEV